MGKRIEKRLVGTGTVGTSAANSRPFGVEKDEVIATRKVGRADHVITIAEGLSSSGAKKLASALNREVRSALFKPKSHGSRSRTKGHSFEREVAIKLREVFPEAKRQLEYQIDTCVGVDIANTDHFKIQCKKLKKYGSISLIGEVECDRDLGEVPILVTAGDGKEPMAVLPLDELIKLLKVFVG